MKSFLLWLWESYRFRKEVKAGPFWVALNKSGPTCGVRAKRGGWSSSRPNILRVNPPGPGDFAFRAPWARKGHR